MEFPGHDLTREERFLVVFLSLLLIGLCYYQFIYRPWTRQIQEYEAQRGALNMELTQVQNRIQQLKKMKGELDRLGYIGYTSRMPSYNSVEAETSFLNLILRPAEQYSISFSNPTRTGDQVRRNVALRFTASGYNSAESILKGLISGDFRCLLGDVRYAGSENGQVTVNVTTTFFETMVGGAPDPDLR